MYKFSDLNANYALAQKLAHTVFNNQTTRTELSQAKSNDH